MAAARGKARSAGVEARLIEGDVTRLPELGLGGPFDLLLDIGCYHSLFPVALRDDYAHAVTEAAAPGAMLLLYGFLTDRKPEHTVTGDELRQRFSGWELLGEDGGVNWLPTTAFRLRRHTASRR